MKATRFITLTTGLAFAALTSACVAVPVAGYDGYGIGHAYSYAVPDSHIYPHYGVYPGYPYYDFPHYSYPYPYSGYAGHEGAAHYSHDIGPHIDTPHAPGHGVGYGGGHGARPPAAHGAGHSRGH